MRPTRCWLLSKEERLNDKAVRPRESHAKCERQAARRHRTTTPRLDGRTLWMDPPAPSLPTASTGRVCRATCTC